MGGAATASINGNALLTNGWFAIGTAARTHGATVNCQPDLFFVGESSNLL